MMTNEELKKKIVDILVNCKSDRCAIEYCAECDGNPCIENCREQQFADALIAAGIGDISEYNNLAYEVRCNLTSVTRYIHNKDKQYNKKYKELAEKAVNSLLKLVNNPTQEAEKEHEEEKEDD